MVNYLCLPPPGWRPPKNQVCMISGWGLHSGVDGPGGEVRTEQNRRRFTESKLALVRHYETDECECVLNEAQLDAGAKLDKNMTISGGQLCFGHKDSDLKFNLAVL